MKPKIIIIGCGGVGSWLTPSLCLLAGTENVTVVDGDKLEEKNLNRQLFTSGEIGWNKATALGLKYKCQWIPEWFSFGSLELRHNDWLIVCVDNNPARLAAIESADADRLNVIVAANETNSSEAYYYCHEWRGTPLDPRVYIPDLRTNHAGDPLAAGIGCTGAVQESNRQLVSANYMAAGLAQHLFCLWALKVPKLDAAIIDRLPYRLIANMSRLENKLVGEALVQQQTERTANE